MTTEAGIYLRPVISKIKMEKEINRVPALEKLLTNPAGRKSERNNRMAYQLRAGGGTDYLWLGCVAASEAPSEPCSMTFRGRKRQRGQTVQKVTGRRERGRYRGGVKKRIQECG